MKHLLPLYICLLFVLSSCKKNNTDSPTPANTITATVDGVNLNFSTYASARRDSAIAGVINIFGSTVTSGPGQVINLGAESNNPKTPTAAGTYVSLGYASNAGTADILCDNVISDTPGSQSYVDYNTVLNSPNNITTIQISSISTTSVQGTFSGKLIVTTGDTTKTKVITNGKFNVTFTN